MVAVHDRSIRSGIGPISGTSARRQEGFNIDRRASVLYSMHDGAMESVPIKTDEPCGSRCAVRTHHLYNLALQFYISIDRREAERIPTEKRTFFQRLRYLVIIIPGLAG